MFSEPLKNLKQFGLRENMIVADLGAGTGFYSMSLAQMVPQGKVYAVEVQKDFVTTIKNKAIEATFHNLECIWGDIEKIGGTKLKDEIIDAVVASNVLSQIENKDKFVEEAKRIMKTGARILVIDWSPNWLSIVSPKSKKVVSKENAREVFEKKGFLFEQEINAGAHHYGIILRKL